MTLHPLQWRGRDRSRGHSRAELRRRLAALELYRAAVGPARPETLPEIEAAIRRHRAVLGLATPEEEAAP